MCQLHTTVAMIAANQSYRALNGQFFPSKILEQTTYLSYTIFI